MKDIFYDIETPKGGFLASFKLDGEWVDFSVNSRQNDVYKLIKFLDSNVGEIFIGYNNVSFDGCVIEWIWRTYDQWVDKDGEQIALLIWEYAQDIIERGNYGLFPPYREYELSFKQLDIFRIQHFDNKNRRVGLKRVEYEMDMENVEEMPIHHTHEHFTPEEWEMLIGYCHNDIEATINNYKHITGDVNHPVYKGTNQRELREALTEAFGIDCTNYSNSKYGDEIIKKLYCKEAGINIKQIPRIGTFRKAIPLAGCIPKYIEFQTPELKEFLASLKEKTLLSTEEFEENVLFRGQNYTFARGGIHNLIKNKQYHNNDEYIIIDADVTGYYPRTILNNQYCPKHLDKKAFITAFKWLVDQREELKPLSKTDKRIKGIITGYKEAANAAYGKSGDSSNWMFDLKMMLSVCITGELSILMLIEQQELAGNKCIMANTDGATFYVKRTEKENFHKICEQWCKMTSYALEFFQFKSMWFLSVNDYLALYEEGWSDPISGNVKRKGDFITYTELHKNKSFRVIALALSAYFIEGKDVEQYINEFDNIYHFCGRSTGGKSYYHEGITKDGVIPLPNLVRYYVANKGIRIMKMVREDCETKAKDTSVSPKDLPKMVCNKLPESSHEGHLANINRKWYIDQARDIIFRLEHGRAPKSGYNNPDQLKLF